MEQINLELYRTFYHVGKVLSFSEASNNLGITQSAVSQSIKALENQINCRLFIRTTKNVRFTPAGETLFKYVEQAFNLLSSGQNGIKEIMDLKRGEIHIASTDTICRHFLLPYLKKYTELYPNIKIKITNRTSPVCIDLLRKGSVDFAVVNIPKNATIPSITVTPRQYLHDVFVASPQYFSAFKDKTINISELSNYPILALEKNSVTRQILDNFLLQHNLDIQPEIELSSIDVLIDLAKIGLGLAFVSEEYALKAIKKGELIVINTSEQLSPRTLGTVVPSNIPITAAAKKFVDLLPSL